MNMRLAGIAVNCCEAATIDRVGARAAQRRLG
jgi:hypothetical protein